MALPLRPRLQCLHRTTTRNFSSSPSSAVRSNLQWHLNNPEALADAVPPYPYGPTRWYKQSAKGLYGGQRIIFGNNVSPDTETKTRRSWEPNVKVKKLFSKALNRYVQVRVTTKVLRTIDKLGGLDEYLLGEKEMRIKCLGESGWWLRWAVMQTPGVRRRFEEERARLGLPEDVPESESADAAAAAASTEGEMEAPVPTDEAFVVEDSPDLPPLRWRVAPHQHLVLSSNGWKRVREDPSYRKELAKKPIRAAKETHMKERLKAVEAELERQGLRAAEFKEALKASRRELRVEMEAEVEGVFLRRLAKKEVKKEVRGVEAKERRKQRRAEEEH